MKIQFEPNSLSLISENCAYEKLTRKDDIVNRKPSAKRFRGTHLQNLIYFLFCMVTVLGISLFLFIKLCKPWYETVFIAIGTFQLQDIDNNTQLVDISWSKCGTDKYGEINSLAVSPNPISLHKNVTFSLEANVFIEVTSPLKIEVKVEKKILFNWIKIPCIDSFGSCTYTDVCKFSPYIHNSTCDLPIPHSHLPCKCPIEVGRYYANHSIIHVVDPAKFIPKWLKDGKYWARVNGFNNGTNIGCYEFTFAVTS